MLHAVLMLVALQCFGDLISAAASLPIPGMVLGLVSLLSVLSLRGWRLGRERAVPDALNRVAGSLHGHFGLLFVPAGAGVMANIDMLATEGLPLLATVLLSTAATIATTATVAAWRSKVALSAGTATAE